MSGKSLRTSDVILVPMKELRNPTLELRDFGSCAAAEGILEQLLLNLCWQAIPLREYGRAQALEDVPLLLTERRPIPGPLACWRPKCASFGLPPLQGHRVRSLTTAASVGSHGHTLQMVI